MEKSSNFEYFFIVRAKNRKIWRVQKKGKKSEKKGKNPKSYACCASRNDKFFEKKKF